MDERLKGIFEAAAPAPGAAPVVAIYGDVTVNVTIKKKPNSKVSESGNRTNQASAAET